MINTAALLDTAKAEAAVSELLSSRLPVHPTAILLSSPRTAILTDGNGTPLKTLGTLSMVAHATSKLGDANFGAELGIFRATRFVCRTEDPPSNDRRKEAEMKSEAALKSVQRLHTQDAERAKLSTQTLGIILITDPRNTALQKHLVNRIAIELGIPNDKSPSGYSKIFREGHRRAFGRVAYSLIRWLRPVTE